MPDPFLVLATQNPIETEGVYPLPEAQRDRFLFKIIVDYPRPEEEREIVYRMGAEPPVAQQVLGPDELLRLQGVASRVFVHHALVDYVVRLVVATRTPAEHGLDDVASWVAYGASPRATLGIVAAARALALIRGRDYVLPQDVLDVAPDVLRHRLVLSYDAVADVGAGRPHRRQGPGDGPAAAGHRPPAGGTPAGRLHAGTCLRAAAMRSGPTRPPRTPAGRPPAPDQVVVTAPAPPGGAAHPGRQEGHLEDVRRPEPGVTDARVRRTPITPPSLRDGRIEAALRSLELTVRGRLDGLLQGNHLGLVPGPGSEPGEARIYQPGDDVRRMDWAVTARTTLPHVRQTVADRELETWVVMDLSASLDFGTAACEKRDLAVAALAAVTHLTAGGGNRIGVVVSTGEQTVRIPARGGLEHARGMLRRVARTPRAPVGTRGDLASAVEALRRPPRRRGLAVVVSDFLGEPEWERAMRALSARHELLAVEVLDPRELELPDVGTVVLADPETGRQREVQTTPLLCREFAAAASAHRDRVAVALRRCGAAHLRLRTDSDWVADIVRFVLARKRTWSGG